MDGTRPWFVRTAAAGACGQIGDPRTAGTLVDALDSEEWYPRNAAATALVRLEDAGVAAVCSRVASLEPESVAHYWGLLDAAGRTEAIIVRAAAGERRVRRFVTAAARAGATARLEELAAAGVGDRAATRRSCSGPRRPWPSPSRDGGDGVIARRSSGINHVVLAYFVILLGSYSPVTLLSWVQVRRYYRRLVHARLQRSVRSR